MKIHDLKYQKDANAFWLYQSILKHILGGVEEVYLVVVERLVGVDGHEDCGKAEGVVVDQEESDDGDHDLRHDGGEDGDGHAERWWSSLPGVVNVHMVEEVMVEEEEDLIHWVICPNPAWKPVRTSKQLQSLRQECM